MVCPPDFFLAIIFNYLVILLAFDEFVDEPADDEGLDGHGNLQQRDEGGPNIQSL